MSQGNAEKIKSELASILDNFAKIIKASKMETGSSDSRKAPGDLLEVYAERMLQSCKHVLDVSSGLKRSALLNDVASRNKENKIT